MQKIKENLVEISREVGFDAIGFAEAKALIDDANLLKDWISLGYNATMNFFMKNINKRTNVKEILSNAKTVIMLAVNYFSDIAHSSDINIIDERKIARYAWSKDYHIIIKDMLDKMKTKIYELYPNSENISYVDTGPVMEKRWAEIAGIGWQGKNSLIITKEFGSYVFLAILITNLEIEPDEPSRNLCGNCNLCIESCPTKAISEPRILNASKCISFWTIEEKTGELPVEIKDNLNGWLFGCDICQEVCPWNQKAKPTNNSALFPIISPTINRNEILQMTDKEFKEKFKSSSISRRKLELFKKIIEY